METIRLEFRRGGGWGAIGWYFWRYRDMEPCVAYFEIETKTYHDREYAGPFTLEVVEPDPEPLRIEGCSDPVILNGCKGWVCQSRYPPPDGYEARVYVTAPTRRAAIEAYNAAAKVMGATE